MKRIFAPLLLLSLLLLAACASGNDNPSTGGGSLQVVGVYDYHMLEEGTNNTYDAGAIEFRGDKTYSLLNIYDITYEGDWEYGTRSDPPNEHAIVTHGAIEWVGDFDDTNTLSGTWTNEGASGTWVAVRQVPLEEMGPQE